MWVSHIKKLMIKKRELEFPWENLYQKVLEADTVVIGSTRVRWVSNKEKRVS